MTFWCFVGQDTNYKSLVSTGAIEFIKSDNLTSILSKFLCRWIYYIIRKIKILQ